MINKIQIRQPIVTVCGHVDHGKTTLLDSIRGSSIAEGEAGGITQRISFTLFQKEQIIKRCGLIEKNKIKLEIPGFLFIDTPGHAAFSNLRKRGGALADLAILVIDISEGIMPQTAEVIEILKMNKTPFVIALNKIDKISGWKKQSENLLENINSQAIRTKQEFDEQMMTLMGSLHSHGFEAAPYYEIKDFATKLALVPCSGRTGEGVAELIFALCGLSQKYLKGGLALGKEAKGVILEIKKEKTMEYIEAIIYDGTLKAKDEIAVASFSGEPVIGKLRILEEVVPVSNRFQPVVEASAATGIRMQFAESVEVLPGMPFQIYRGNKDEIIKEFKKQVTEKIRTDEEGVIVKADSLGSLEALMILLREAGIKICRAGIGNIDKKDVISAIANIKLNPMNAIVLGFNVTHEEDIGELKAGGVKVIENEVVYKIIEELQKYREGKQKETEKEKMMKLAALCKLRILPQYVFHNSNPAIFGVRVEAGKLLANTPLMNESGEEINRVKNIQVEKQTVQEATAGMEVAISLPGTNFERQLANVQFLYSDIGAGQFREFKKNKELLSRGEIDVLQKISQIKRSHEPTWGV